MGGVGENGVGWGNGGVGLGGVGPGGGISVGKGVIGAGDSLGTPGDGAMVLLVPCASTRVAVAATAAIMMHLVDFIFNVLEFVGFY